MDERTIRDEVAGIWRCLLFLALQVSVVMLFALAVSLLPGTEAIPTWPVWAMLPLLVAGSLLIVFYAYAVACVPGWVRNVVRRDEAVRRGRAGRPVG
jgi:hypothetical protein